MKNFSQKFGKIALLGVIDSERKIRGFGKLPNKQNPRPARQRRNGDLRKWVPASYACYESFFLLPITTESPVLPNLRKRKTLQSQKRLQRFLNPIQF